MEIFAFKDFTNFKNKEVMKQTMFSDKTIFVSGKASSEQLSKV